MAGVFKSLDNSDVRITPFRAYKLWSETLDANGSGSIYTVYKANYNPTSNYLNPNPLRDTFDQGNPYFEQNEPTTADGKFQRVVHRSIDHLYYRDFYENNKAAFGSGNINKQYRYLEDQAYTISIPQSKFGESILPGSVEIVISGSVYDYLTTSSLSTLTITDDGFGNLYITSSTIPSTRGSTGAYNLHGEYVSGFKAYEWPSDQVYKYVGAGPVSLAEDLSKGQWCMQTIYSNVYATYLTGSSQHFLRYSPSGKNIPITTLQELDHIGAAWNFSASLSSSITIKPNVVSDYAWKYNFPNDDFFISFAIVPSAIPTNLAGAVLISKQGPVTDLAVDTLGNTYSQVLPNAYPYKVSYTTDRKIRFDRSNGISTFTLTSSVALPTASLNVISVYKSGSLIGITQYNPSFQGTNGSANSASCNIPEKEVNNLSNVYIGNSYKLSEGFDGVIDNLKMYKGNIAIGNKTYLEICNQIILSAGNDNTRIGNVFYNHGMMTLTSLISRFYNIKSIKCRGTHTIWENEISCTIGPGEFNMSCNPTTQEYNSDYNDFTYRPFVTSSYFKPYITSIGLYDDYGRLLAIGKLSTPIQTPNNTDTTFVVKFDR
jgi:hypothetical protein